MDDIITGSNTVEIKKVIANLHKSFSLKDLGELNFFLGIEVKRTNHEILLSQRKYIQELLKKAGMENANGLSTPMISGTPSCLNSKANP